MRSGSRGDGDVYVVHSRTVRVDVVLVVRSGPGEVCAARQAQGGGALSALQRVTHHVLPLVVGDLPCPRRHAQRRQRHGRHRPLHQLDVICGLQEVMSVFILSH